MQLGSAIHTAAVKAAIVAALAATAAQARAPVSLDSAIFVERVQPGNVRSLEPAARLNRGDRVVTLVSWRRDSSTGAFVVTNPVPRAVSYQGSAQTGEEVSADGGVTWGRIGTLLYGSRLATPEDITHVRWLVSSGMSGRIAYSAIVR
jgi:hypothetical protein